MHVVDKHDRAKHASRQIEALLHAATTPLKDKQLKDWLGLSQNELDSALIILQERLSFGALTLRHTATGYSLQIHNDFSALIQRIFPERREHLSQALLETLSVIAYKQPITRGEIEQIRGVSVTSGVLRQLFDKEWIIEQGYKDVVGRPALLYTTDKFLAAFGLMSLEELPTLDPMALE